MSILNGENSGRKLVAGHPSVPDLDDSSLAILGRIHILVLQGLHTKAARETGGHRETNPTRTEVQVAFD